jgi:hypothetical protein
MRKLQQCVCACLLALALGAAGCDNDENLTKFPPFPPVDFGAVPRTLDLAIGPDGAVAAAGASVFSPAAVAIRRCDTATGMHTVASGAPRAGNGRSCSVSGTPSVAVCANPSYASGLSHTCSHAFVESGSFPSLCEIHGAATTSVVSVQ